MHTVNSSLSEAVWSYCFNIVALSKAPCRWESRDYKVHFPTFLILNWKVGITQSRGTRSTTKQQRHEHYRGQSPNIFVVHIFLIQILLCNFFSLFNFSSVGLAMASSALVPCLVVCLDKPAAAPLMIRLLFGFAPNSINISANSEMTMLSWFVL